MKRKIINISIFLLILFILINSYTGFFDNMVVSKATELKKVSLCKIIIFNNDRKENCIANVAIETNDSDSCENLISEISGDEIIDSMNANMMGEVWLKKYKIRDTCYSVIAENKLDYILCEKISDEWEKNDCLDNIAKSTNNKDLCDKISDESKKEECVEIIVAFEPGYCEKLPSGYERNSCFARKATWLRNPDDCSNITEDKAETRDNCFRNVAISTNDKRLCEKILGQKTKEYCLSSLSR